MTDYVNLIIWYGKKGDFLTRLFNRSIRYQFAVIDTPAWPWQAVFQFLRPPRMGVQAHP